MRENPFWYPRHQRISGRIEFDAFLKQAEAEVRRCTAGWKRFDILECEYGLSISDESDIVEMLPDFSVVTTKQTTFEVSFGPRSMGRKDLSGKWADEIGATLHYSLGDGGQVATTLYGARSELGRMEEKMIFLRIGHYSAHQLKSFIERDIC